MIELIHGDSIEDWAGNINPGSYDHIITDPPYTDYVHKRLLAGKKKSEKSDSYVKEIECTFDELPPQSIWLQSMNTFAKRWALYFCALEQLGEYQAADRDHWVRSGIYCKMRAMPQMTGDRPGNRCEGVAIFHGEEKKRWNGGGTHAFWLAMPQNRKDVGHPTSKPLMLCMRLVEQFTDIGEHVFDPFCGTGNIGLACSLLERNYTGIDISEDYIRIAAERLHNLDREHWLKKFEEYKVKYG